MATPKRPKIYMATKDGFFGIKKNDLFAIDAHGILHRTTDQQPVDIDPEVETDFFQAVIVPEGQYKAGEMVVAPKNLEGVIVGDVFPFPTLSSRNKTIFPAWASLEVLGYVQMGKAGKPEIVLRLGRQVVRAVESRVRLSESYFFINSQGDIHGTELGRDDKKDLWCKQSGNYYLTREAANAAKAAIVAKYDPRPSQDVIHRL